jgi:eukaryotic translation initiation factor 2C
MDPFYQSSAQGGSRPGSQHASPTRNPRREGGTPITSRPGSPRVGPPSPTQRSQPGSLRGAEAPNYPTPLGYDPGRLGESQSQRGNNRIDLPPEAYLAVSFNGLKKFRNYCAYSNKPQKPSDGKFTRRPGFNKSGKEIPIDVNQFRLASIGNSDIYQYDVSCLRVA